jgi:dolichol-phosphate mannosyltransferase
MVGLIREMPMATREYQDVGIVIPTYNEGESIAGLITRIRQIAPGAAIAVVDDSPGLETANAVRGLSDPSIELIKRTSKGGRGSAVIEGLRLLHSPDGKQKCDRFLEMDADFSHPPEQIPEILQTAQSSGADLLIASRYMPGSSIKHWSLSRRMFSCLSNRLAKTVLEVPVSDYTNGYRFYSKKAVELIIGRCGQRGSGFIALSEILVTVYYNGLRVHEIPTHFVNRVRGQSSLNHKEILNAVNGLLKVYGLKRRLVIK